MISNLSKYKKDYESLVDEGQRLYYSLHKECFPKEFAEEIKSLEGEARLQFENLPNFRNKYQSWYSEAKAVIRQLLPDRVDDFVRLYEKNKARKEISFENYKIEDCLQGLIITRGLTKEKVVGPDAALPQLFQQIAIVESIRPRFESSLFDIQQLVQADLFDSELDSARELSKQKFLRAAGAVAGVVLERHLSQVCKNHGVIIRKKNPTISTFNDLLKEENVIDVPQWRFIQHLGDIRNLCDHHKESDPAPEQLDDLISGVDKITKTVF